MTVSDWGLASPPEENFTPAVSRPVVEAACRLVGLDATGAILLRHQTNGVYQLTTGPAHPVQQIRRAATFRLNIAAACKRTCSRRARPEAVRPPPSGHLTILV